MGWVLEGYTLVTLRVPAAEEFVCGRKRVILFVAASMTPNIWGTTCQLQPGRWHIFLSRTSMLVPDLSLLVVFLLLQLSQVAEVVVVPQMMMVVHVVPGLTLPKQSSL